MARPRQHEWTISGVLRAVFEVGRAPSGPGAMGGAGQGAQMRAWSGSWKGAGWVLIVLCLAVYLPGLWSIPPVDRDESRFAQASRTMLESGDWVVPRIQDTPRLNKPPLIYWLQAGSAWVFGDGPGADGLGQWGNGNIWVFRLPSVLCAIGAVLLTWRVGLRMFDPRAAALGAALLAVCPMVVWDAHQARADQLLLLATTGAMFALFVCWRESSGRQEPSHASPERSEGPAHARRTGPSLITAIALWTCIALGILVKGPITPLIVVLTIAGLSITARSVRWIWSTRPLLGIPIVMAIVGPWVYLVAHRVGWSEYWSIVVKETLGRSADAAEGHWGPPGYHTVLLAVLFWPGSLLTAAAIVRAWRRSFPFWPRRGRSPLPWASAHGTNAAPPQAPEGRQFLPRAAPRPRPELFLLVWIIPAWLLFELIATKLPHYTMPLYPAIALLSARAVLGAAALVGASSKFWTRGTSVGFVLWRIIGLVLIAGIPLAVWLTDSAFLSALGIVPTAFFVIIALLLTAFPWRALIKGRYGAAMGRAVIVQAVFAALLMGALLPSANLWLSRNVVGTLLRHEPHWQERPLAAVGFHEDSLTFLARGRVTRLGEQDITNWLARIPDGVLIIPGSVLESRRDLRVINQGEPAIVGYNYSNGRRVWLVLVERAERARGQP